MRHLGRPASRHGRLAAEGTIVVIIVAFLAGTNGVAAAVTYDDGGGVGTVLAARALGGLLLGAAVAVFQRRLLPTRPAAPTIGLLALVLTTNAVTFFYAVDRLSPGVVAIILFSYPALVVVASALLGWSHLTPLGGLAVCVSFAGVLALVGFPGESLDPLGLLLAILGAVSAAVYMLLVQTAMKRTSPIGAFAAAGAGSGLMLLILAATAGRHELPGPRGWVALAWIAILGTATAHILLFHGIRLIGSARAATIGPIEVLFSVALALALVEERITWGTLVGGLLVILGAVVTPWLEGRRLDRRRA